MARPYRSAARAAAAARTRAAVLNAARSMFEAEGWNSTTIAGVAKHAGVSTETVYALFGSKKTLITALIEQAVRRGQDAPMMQQERTLAVFQESDDIRRLALFAADVTEILARVAPLMGVVRTAAETDGEIAQLYTRLQEGRRANLAALALKFTGQDTKSLTQTLWRLASPDLFLLVTRVEGRTQEEYRAWLERTLIAVLRSSA